MTSKKKAPETQTRSEAGSTPLDDRILAEIAGLSKQKRVKSGKTGRTCCHFAMNLAVGGLIGAILAGWPA